MRTMVRLFKRYLRFRLMAPLLLALLFHHSEAFADISTEASPAAALTGEEITEQITGVTEDTA